MPGDTLKQGLGGKFHKNHSQKRVKQLGKQAFWAYQEKTDAGILWIFANLHKR